MKFVTVTVNLETHRIVCVDGVFELCSDAQEHADKITARMNTSKYSTSVEVVTKPE